MDQERRIKDGLLFAPGDETLVAMKLKAHDLSQAYSQTREEETQKRAQILAQLLGSFGEGSFIQGPVFFHYGCHTHIGKNFFANYDLIIQDDGEVTIGDDCSFGPGVCIVTPVHPMLPGERRYLQDPEGQRRHMCWAKPVCIGNDCWLGARVVVCPGVTIRDGCVIGAGSVVTRDIPAGHFAAGNPCRVIRAITEADSVLRQPDILGGCTVE